MTYNVFGGTLNPTLYVYRRYCFCSSFLVRDELYCCINAMALSALSFTTIIFDAAVLSSWYEGSSFHSVVSLATKFCAFIFPFNERTSKIAAVLCVTQLARQNDEMLRVLERKLLQDLHHPGKSCKG